MDTISNVLCHDIHGDVHIVDRAKLIQRSSVYGVIQNDGAVLFVQDRSRSDERWDLPGGGSSPHEALLDALKREIKEETNLDVKGNPQKICEFIEYFYDIESRQGWEYTRHFYRVEASGTLHSAGNGDDVIAAHYFKSPLSSASPVAQEIIRMCTDLVAK